MFICRLCRRCLSNWRRPAAPSQLTLTASLIGLGVGQLLFGPLSDKIGRKRPLIFVVATVYCFFHLCATTNNIYWLVVWLFYSRDRGGR
ncbi:MFS transporter [Escherichia coli]